MNQRIIIDENQKADFSMPFDFPIRVYETDLKKKPNGYNGWHWHEELQFCVVTSGFVHMVVQDKEYCLHPGEGIFINTGCIHMSWSQRDCAAEYLCLNIHPQMFSFFRGSAMEQKYYLPFIQNEKLPVVVLQSSSSWQKQMLDLQFDILNQMQEKGKGFELEIYIQMMQLWKLLVLNTDFSKVSASPSLRHKEVKNIITYIHKNYDRHISLDKIAEEIHMSKSGCCRIFKKMLNCTISYYLTEYRIQRGMELLEITDVSVTQIAYDTGFSSVSYFIKKFHEIVTMTPGAYREFCKGRGSG